MDSEDIKLDISNGGCGDVNIDDNKQIMDKIIKKHKKNKKHKHHKEKHHHHKNNDEKNNDEKKKKKKIENGINGKDVNINDEEKLLKMQKIKMELPSDDEEEKKEDDDDDNIPLSKRKKILEKIKIKEEYISSTDDDIPLSRRKRKRTPSPSTSRKKIKTKSSSPITNKNKNKKSISISPIKKNKIKKEEQMDEIWEWWKEDRKNDGFKWKNLEHKGPVFAPDYEKLPKFVQFKYNGKLLLLTDDTEEVAGFYARFIEHEYTTKMKFNDNFFKDWRKIMTKSERELIIDLKKCDFSQINDFYKQKSEERKAMSKEEKLKIKLEKEEIQKEYGVCTIDGHKEKIGNFNIEPPGLFRGRGEHPKMGMLKKRVLPEDVIINCSRDSKFPIPPIGHKWKEIRHDNEVSWLANWTENVQGQGKYVMLNPTSRLKGEKDWLKYEKARELSKHINKIRTSYKNEWHSKEMKVRQRAVAMYFIDKLALRAGNEKDEEQADTVGCCSLRYEHIKLHETYKGGKENVVIFDFLGKDSIRYYNEVEVERRVFKNLKIFIKDKKKGDDLFDRLNTALLNKHLAELLDGLTAKVFRTFNASHTLQQQLDEMTPKKGTIAEKLLAYNRANRSVAVLCNHQRAVPKSHEKSMENLEIKIEGKRDEVKKLKKELKGLNKGGKEHEKKMSTLKRLEEQLAKLEMNRTDKEEGKEIALGTSKLNYLDPRISVAWCKKWNVPFEKVYNKTQRAKFRWAIDMADKNFKFD